MYLIALTGSNLIALYAGYNAPKTEINGIMIKMLIKFSGVRTG